MDRLLVIEEVADVTRAPVRTLRYWRQTGGGPPAFRLGRRLVYRESDVHTWIDNQRDAELSA
jgi:DNA-binding transcriptional MerR regulator